MTYEEALAYLDSLVNYEQQREPSAVREVKPERMRRLCQRLGDPQRSFRSVLVAGTNGKGSVCAMLYSMLRETNLRVGLYTSPHLDHMRERIRTWTAGPSVHRRAGDDWIGEADLAALVDAVRPATETLRAESPQEAPTYFEVLTAVACVHFQRQRLDVAVLEVGLGGRLDATNIVEQAVSLITPIDVDHASILGTDPVRIAQEKAGIIKPRQSVLTAVQHGGVITVLRAACEAQGVPLAVCGQDFTVGIHDHGFDGLQISITGLRGIYDALQVRLAGRHQAQNAALAVAGLEALSSLGVPSDIVERGLSQVDWPGRFEVVHEAPLVILDGAHNPHAAAALADALKELCHGRRIHGLIGVSSDKAVEAIGEQLGPIVAGMTCTASHHPRALEPTALAMRLAPFCPDVHVMSDPIDAYTYLFNVVSPRDVIVVAGSLFLVGELRAAIRQAQARARRAAVEA